MRSGNWNVRMASIKQMAALFSAYDRTTYQRLIPRHVAELLKAPRELLHCLQDGGFAVRLSGNYKNLSCMYMYIVPLLHTIHTGHYTCTMLE